MKKVNGTENTRNFFVNRIDKFGEKLNKHFDSFSPEDKELFDRVIKMGIRE